MLKKMTIRLRLTVIIIFLLTVCCIGLAATLNFSANRMVDVIEAVPIYSAAENGQYPIAFSDQQAVFIDEYSVPISDTSQAARMRFFYQSILYVILIVTVGGALTYYLSGKALSPLRELSAQMKNRTVHNLSEGLPVPQSNDEIAELTLSFNQMTAKLEEGFAMQKRFSQSAAHELRTPLTVLKTKVDVFKKKPLHTAQEYDKLLEVITNHTNRLSFLVQDLLELTNMDTLACTEPIKLKGMAMEICEELSGIAKDKSIVITVCGEEQEIYGSKRLLHRAFYNLIENAIRYTQDNGQVKVTVDAGDGGSTVRVADTGIGIPQELQELVFEPFFCVDKSRSRTMGGVGLGLATVKSIIEHHNGKISLSDNPSGGTVFKVDI